MVIKATARFFLKFSWKKVIDKKPCYLPEKQPNFTAFEPRKGPGITVIILHVYFCTP